MSPIVKFLLYISRNSLKCRMSGSSTKKSCESSAIFQDSYTKYLKLEGFKSQNFSFMKQNVYGMIYSIGISDLQKE